jgi:23S rRNA pseudouridine1911/1915/1917 synthase
VHRLDKDTSGVLLVAKDPVTLERLSLAFKERRVHKTYMAVVHGRPRALSGTIELPIGRHPVDRKKMAVRLHDGRPAVSRYEVVQTTGAISLLRLFPETGRTHQLRVHLTALGHPILGDQVYGGYGGHPRNSLEKSLAPFVPAFPRQALHAKIVELMHPLSGQPLRVRAPYPEDFRQLLTLFPEALQRENREEVSC